MVDDRNWCREICEKMRKLKEVNSSLKNTYFGEYGFSGDITDVFNFGYDADQLYKDFLALKGDLVSLCNHADFKMEKTGEKYQGMVSEVDSIIAGLISDVRNVVNLLKDSGGYLTETEQATFDKWRVYRDGNGC